MKPSGGRETGSGIGLIVLGLALAVLGAGAVMLLVVALSHLYVGVYPLALGELAACAVAGGAFLKAYGPYLDRLERRAPPEPAEAGAGATPAGDPAPTGVVVAVVTGAYGLILILAGLVWTSGTARLLNGVGGLGLVACAALVWWAGRESR